MKRTLYRLGGLVALSLALAAAAMTSGTSVLARSVGPTRIGPNQFFAGEVNGKMHDAIVKVVCPGPANVGGHALPGQTISVTWNPVITVDSGYTGAARSIAATVGPAASTGETILFKQYDQPAEFPTNILVPCGGTGLVIFSPVAGGKSAKSSTVTVEYANVGTGS